MVRVKPELSTGSPSLATRGWKGLERRQAVAKRPLFRSLSPSIRWGLPLTRAARIVEARAMPAEGCERGKAGGGTGNPVKTVAE